MSHLPKRGEKGTPPKVFEVSGDFDSKPVKTRPVLKPEDIAPPQHEIVDASEERRAELQLARRQEKVGHPGKLAGSDAETFVEKKKVELSVDAVVELEYALKYGTSGERERARDRILDATGHGKKDKVSGGANLIIVNMGNSGNGSPAIDLPPVLRSPLLSPGTK